MKRPSVSANLAISLDGKVAGRSRGGALELRTESDAILIGGEALKNDDISLGKRRAKRLRVIITDDGRLRRGLRIFQDGAPFVVFTTKAMGVATRRWLEKFAMVYVEPRAKKVNLRRLLEILSRDHGVRSAWCEGGGEVFRAFLKQGLMDTLHLTILPVVMGGANAPTLLGPAHSSLLPHSIPLRLQSFQQRGDKALATYRVLQGQ